MVVSEVIPFPVTSVIVCTRDRPAKVLACLESIAESAVLSGVQVEIVLVENGSKPELQLSEGAIEESGRGLCRFVRRSYGCLSDARNEAMRLAGGGLFVFIDDDCVVAPQYLDDLMRHASEMKAQGVWHYLIGGRVVLGDMRDLPFTIKDDPDPQVFHTGVHPGGFVQGCNFFLSRETAALIGPFDPRFGPGSRFKAGEDTDYLIRAHEAGVSVRYVPDLPVMHFHGRQTFAEVDGLNRDYAFANGAILAKHFGRHPWLGRHLAWTIRSSLKERFGGPGFNTAVGLSWGSVLTAQIRGAWAFALEVVGAKRLML